MVSTLVLQEEFWPENQQPDPTTVCTQTNFRYTTGKIEQFFVHIVSWLLLTTFNKYLVTTVPPYPSFLLTPQGQIADGRILKANKILLFDPIDRTQPSRHSLIISPSHRFLLKEISDSLAAACFTCCQSKVTLKYFSSQDLKHWFDCLRLVAQL